MHLEVSYSECAHYFRRMPWFEVLSCGGSSSTMDALQMCSFLTGPMYASRAAINDAVCGEIKRVAELARRRLQLRPADFDEAETRGILYRPAPPRLTPRCTAVQRYNARGRHQGDGQNGVTTRGPFTRSALVPSRDPSSAPRNRIGANRLIGRRRESTRDGVGDAAPPGGSVAYQRARALRESARLLQDAAGPAIAAGDWHLRRPQRDWPSRRRPPPPATAAGHRRVHSFKWRPFNQI